MDKQLLEKVYGSYEIPDVIRRLLQLEISFYSNP